MKNENRKQKKYLLILLFLLFPLKPFAPDSLYHIATSNCYGNVIDTALTDSFYLSLIDTLLSSFVSVEWSDVKYNTKQLTINPNPFYPKANITISGIQKNGVIKLNIIDSNGRIVKIMSANANTGMVSYTWDGTDQNGKAMARGVYVAKVVGMGVNLKKLLVLTR